MKDLEVLAREEQERIADELHDGIAHDLTLVLFHARAFPRQPDEAARQVSLTTIEDSAEKALLSIQSLLALMREPRAEGAQPCPTRYESDAVEAVSSLGALLTDAGIPTRVSAPQESLDATPPTERVLVETAIEAVTNILKHAPNSQSVSVDIHRHIETIELVVNNVAAPLTKEKSARTSGRGLHRAHQRLAQHGGQLESGATAEGWTLRATLPCTTTAL